MDGNINQGATQLVDDTALYDAFGKLHADIDTQTEGFARTLLDPVGYRGQQGQYTDVETLSVDAGTVASGTYLSLLGPAGLYYDPATGQACGRMGGVNDYEVDLNLFANYSASQYFRDSTQFAIGELKGTGNYVAASAIDLYNLSTPGQLFPAPERLKHPLMANGEGQRDGDWFADKGLFIASLATPEGEAAEVAGLSKEVKAAASVADESHITYVIRDAEGEVVYVGKSSGTGTPEEVLKKRFGSIRRHRHYNKAAGDTYHIIDVQESRDASAGAEDVWFEYYKWRGARLRNVNAPLDFKEKARRIRSFQKLKAYNEERQRR